MRKCTAVYWDTAEKKQLPVSGRFHAWGSEYEEFSEGPCGNSTIAIIEREDGQIVTALPHTVKFEVPS